MVAACPRLQAVLDADDVNDGRTYMEVADIARVLAEQGDECITGVMAMAEEVLRDFGQEGRDFIGAGFTEGIPDPAAARRLGEFAGPLTLEEIDATFGPRWRA
jgi:hypothetical protein